MMDHKQVEALDRLRTAIIEDVREDMEDLEDLNEWHASLVGAWDAFVKVSESALKPITQEDVVLPRIPRTDVS